MPDLVTFYDEKPFMNSLGASEVTCEALRSVERKTRIRAEVPKQGVEGGLDRVECSSFDYHYSGVGSAPEHPGELLWPEEPGFQAGIHSVLVNGASKIELTIRTTDGFSANAQLIATIKKVGLDVGERRGSERTTSLRIRAAFPARSGVGQRP